jgi:ferrous iron transport protein A
VQSNDKHYHLFCLFPSRRISMTSQTLDQLSVGTQARIIGFTATEANFRRKLLALGLMPGTQIEVRRFAPLGDPMQIQLRGASVSLRKQEASIIQVEVIV